MEIDFEGFKKLCRVEPGEEGDIDGAEWAPWIRIKPDGVYLKLPSDDEIKGFPELLKAMDLPEDLDEDAKNGKAPILSFPASAIAFERFLEAYSLYGCVDPFDYVEWQTKQYQQSGMLKDQPLQVQAIIDEIERQGHNPRDVLASEKYGWAKGAVRDAMRSKSTPFRGAEAFEPKGTFNKAWQRARDRFKDE